MLRNLLMIGTVSLFFNSCLPTDGYTRVESYINGVPNSGQAVCADWEGCETKATQFCQGEFKVLQRSSGGHKYYDLDTYFHRHYSVAHNWRLLTRHYLTLVFLCL